MAESLTQKKFLDLTGLGAFWAKAKGYVDAKSSGLTGVIDGLKIEYVSGEKKIYLKKGDTNLGTAIDCTDFVKDSFVKSGEIVEKEVEGEKKQTLRLTLITVDRPGAEGTPQNVDIDVDKLFSQKAADIKMNDGKTVEWAITDVTGNLETLRTAHNAAVGEFKAADTELDGKITALDTAYKAADNALGDRITTLEGSANDYVTADETLKGEIEAAYKAADAALDQKITNLNGSITNLNGSIADLDAAYKAADTAVYNSITAIETTEIDALFTGAQA